MKLYLTKGINAKVADDGYFSYFITHSIKRHFNNDWSECEKEDAAANEQALKDGSRLFSVYRFNEDVQIWIITEAKPHRDITTVLLPEDY